MIQGRVYKKNERFIRFKYLDNRGMKRRRWQIFSFIKIILPYNEMKGLYLLGLEKEVNMVILWLNKKKCLKYIIRASLKRIPCYNNIMHYDKRNLI